MNVLSDILCNSSPLILSSSYNAPLLSHNTSVGKSVNKGNHLIQSLQHVDATSEQLENGIYHHLDNRNADLMPMNYGIGQTNSEFPGSNQYDDSVQSWFTNDLIKVSESILSAEENVYGTEQTNANLNVLEMGFPPDITNPDSVDCNIGASCMSNSPSFISVANGFHSSDSLLMSSFNAINDSSLSVEKPNQTCQKYGSNEQPANTTQSLISNVFPLNNHCDLNGSNELLSLTNQIDSQHLAPNNSNDVQNNQRHNPSLDNVTDKLPHIAFTQLDSIFRIGNTLDDIQVMSNEFPNSSNEHSYGAYHPNMDMMSCNNNSLPNLNINDFTHEQEMIHIQRTLPETNLNTVVTINENVIDSAIEQTCCFRCKYCNFISLEKDAVRHHIQGVHVRNINHTNTITGNTSFHLNNATSTSNHLISNTLNNHLNSSTSLEVNHNSMNFVTNMHFPNTQSVNTTSSHMNCTEFSNSNIKTIDAHRQNIPKPSYLHLEPNKTKFTKTLDKTQADNVSGVAALNFNNIHPKKMIELVETRGNPVLNNNQCDTSAVHMPKKTNMAKKTVPDESKTVSPQRRISAHIKAWQKKMKRELGSYICEFKGCNVRFRALDNLEYHRKCHMTTVGKFACPECGKNFDHWGTTAGHLWRLHTTDMELFACNQCSFRTYSSSTLENIHKPLHQDKCHFLCDTCGKGFKNGKQLRNHRELHDKKPNNAAKTFVCTICGRQFFKKKNFMIHINVVHNKQRSYSCSYCQFTTYKSGTLLLHVRQHTGEKCYRCDQCDYQTVDHNSLRRHKMKHSGEKPYKCPYCPYACIQASTYKVHLRKNHPEQSEQSLVFSCTFCKFRTLKHESYSTHMAMHEHKNNTRPSTNEVQKQTDADVLPLVAAVDISLSHNDPNMFLGANKEKTTRPYSWNDNCSNIIDPNTLSR